MTEPAALVAWLRAAGEPTRLRLLALCAERDLNVSDLALAVGQSDPRVSRHLKILCAAGLLLRVRRGQWVHYRPATDADTAAFLSGVLAQLDPADPHLAHDRGRVQSARLMSADAPPVRARLDLALGAFITTSAGAERRTNILILGAEHHAVLASAARIANECTAVAHSRSTAREASAFVARAGVACRVLTAARAQPIERVLSHSGERFDAVVLDRVAERGAALPAWLATARRLILPSGRLWLFERCGSLDAPGAALNPLARLRRHLDEADFACERVSPIDTDGEHVLAAVAVPAMAVRAASVA